jgi:elongation factor 1 alpha-like protein
MNKLAHQSEKIGKKSFAYAWVMDETSEERERGVTVDIAFSQFETEKHHFTLLDAPGHRDFIPNMISGAAQADVAILVVDSSPGEFETGFSQGGQTKEHALLIRSLGVTQVAVAVNKLDMVDWDEGRFNLICSSLGDFLQSAGFAKSKTHFVPCSGLKGENLIKRVDSTHPLSSWYSGPSLLEVVDAFSPPQRSISLPLRLPVSDFFKGGVGSSGGVSITGRIAQGNIQLGETITVMPGGETGQVKTILVNEETAPWAIAGDSVSITLAGIDIMQFR